jgi:exopolyphosphatase/guanosine-5'-triphosphate,3'-diphosphate pyrophosphatase
MRCSLGRNEKWIKVNTSDYEEVTLIGSGGNNKLFKMSGTGQEKPLYLYMTSQYSFLNSLTYEQRIAELGLNRIVPMLLFLPLESISMQ